MTINRETILEAIVSGLGSEDYILALMWAKVQPIPTHKHFYALRIR